ncbi:2'-5'-RNA ligase [Pseudomonas putida]|uniref:RNA 2',3'-cyclic phosphodiesterase n=1 Tax=Pseudomonas guariconensis TaxID=1288410 RepID=A0AAX0VVI3_9PSED|nr:RNA 2',3'-cyclic phosphodiesterase [Pseudomonas guariconensis]CAB5528950.1 2'-5'-RNA ligase [Pseudomonas putida]PLV18587.1 RNA 2',3'-cyclic phosphodiesterase [Pseudomonas guariconensis]PLV23453.1 RNA 2',3'-cyclic phosphodiesterase [Pseudomonas guariconensis]PLV28476.1 RNA 2',3'-cyclic phosphodiesterase [Pseudomonas guariconensis]CAB5547165.1 2'-5'-RNA ligase [Pseudomonas putida]
MAFVERDKGQPFKRLFFALTVSDAQRRAIAQWRRALALRSGKPVPAQNFHLTLLFLGDVDVAQVPALCAAVDQLKRPEAPIRLVLDRLQVWHRASVLVLEPQQTPPALGQLVYALQQAALPLGVAEQTREYRPHLTLSRDFRAQVPESPSAPEFFLAARSFVLYESRKGAYWPLAEWPLEG